MPGFLIRKAKWVLIRDGLGPLGLSLPLAVGTCHPVKGALWGIQYKHLLRSQSEATQDTKVLRNSYLGLQYTEYILKSADMYK